LSVFANCFSVKLTRISAKNITVLSSI